MAAVAGWHGSCREDRQVRAYAACAGPIRAGIAGSHPDLIPGPALACCSAAEQLCEIRAIPRTSGCICCFLQRIISQTPRIRQRSGPPRVRRSKKQRSAALLRNSKSPAGTLAENSFTVVRWKPPAAKNIISGDHLSIKQMPFLHYVGKKSETAFIGIAGQGRSA